MNKNKISILGILFIAISFFIIGAVWLLSHMEKMPGDIVAVSSHESEEKLLSEIANPKEKEFYTIKTTEDGKIGVYKGETQEPSILLHEIILMALPKFDRDLLAHGITVYSDEELYKLIEDLDG